ncbi:MAG TPA: MerR family transcriptional regulator [Metabacillus sp.]|nr:MerR family transcriptional regulator [Metabacillus sp.]
MLRREKLVFPDRSRSGTRKYSLSDIELLKTIAEQIKEGIHTDFIREQIYGENPPTS